MKERSESNDDEASLNAGSWLSKDDVEELGLCEYDILSRSSFGIWVFGFDIRLLKGRQRRLESELVVMGVGGKTRWGSAKCAPLERRPGASFKRVMVIVADGHAGSYCPVDA